MQACASESPISPENLRVTGPKSPGQWDESILRERMQPLCRGARKPRWSRATAQLWKSIAHDVVCGDAPVNADVFLPVWAKNSILLKTPVFGRPVSVARDNVNGAM